MKCLPWHDCVKFAFVYISTCIRKHFHCLSEILMHKFYIHSHYRLMTYVVLAYHQLTMLLGLFHRKHIVACTIPHYIVMSYKNFTHYNIRLMLREITKWFFDFFICHLFSLIYLSRTDFMVSDENARARLRLRFL
jgi:hypothetical protein